MPPINTCRWLQLKVPYRALTATSTCISFLLLSVSLLSSSWLEVIIPETSLSSGPAVKKLCNNVACRQLSGSSVFMKASRILLTLATVAGFIAAFSLLISPHCLRRCAGPPNILISSAASFATAILGFATMALYTVDVTQKEMSSVGNLHFTWSFCLAWLVFTLYVMNGLPAPGTTGNSGSFSASLEAFLAHYRNAHLIPYRSSISHRTDLAFLLQTTDLTCFLLLSQRLPGIVFFYTETQNKDTYPAGHCQNSREEIQTESTHKDDCRDPSVRMLTCRVFSMAVLPFSVVLLVTALATDHWLVAHGIKSSMHSGLWEECMDGQCIVPATTFGYVIATRAFLILASLLALGSALFLLFSFIPAPCSNRRADLYSSVASLAAGLFTLVAVAVYTAETWNKNADPQVYVKYEWSFYLGWASFPMLLLPGISSLIAYSYSPDSAYQQV